MPVLHNFPCKLSPATLEKEIHLSRKRRVTSCDLGLQTRNSFKKSLQSLHKVEQSFTICHRCKLRKGFEESC